MLEERYNDDSTYKKNLEYNDMKENYILNF